MCEPFSYKLSAQPLLEAKVPNSGDATMNRREALAYLHALYFWESWN